MKKHCNEGIVKGGRSYTNVKTSDYQLFTIIFNVL